MLVSTLEQLVWTKLDDDGTAYPAANVLSALNEAQRFFALLTLCLETTATFPLAAQTAFYLIDATVSNWLRPRRVLNSRGDRLRPASFSVLDALDTNWQFAPGLPARYAQRGFNLLAIYPQPPVADALTVTFAQSPAPLVNPTDATAIPEASAFALANYAAYALRQPEGGQEFQKFVGYFNDFLDEAQRVQALVKERNLDFGYERMPFELANFDRSSLLRWGKP